MSLVGTSKPLGRGYLTKCYLGERRERQLCLAITLSLKKNPFYIPVLKKNELLNKFSYQCYVAFNHEIKIVQPYKGASV